MSPLDFKKNWGAFVAQLKNKKPLTDEQFEYLTIVFERILNGDDANEVLGLKYKRGYSESDAKARQKISLALHWVANAILPETEEGLGLTLDKAFEEAEKHFPDFSYVMLKKYWYSPDKKHMQNPNRNTFDPDSPFDFK